MNAKRKRMLQLALIGLAIVALWGLAFLLRDVDFLGYVKKLHEA